MPSVKDIPFPFRTSSTDDAEGGEKEMRVC